MKSLLIASNNAHKAAEIKAILGGCFDDIATMREMGIEADVIEDGSTFMENAAKKAHEILELSGAYAVLADDSGLMVDALDGAPGVYSARFSGEGHNDQANNSKLLELMREVPQPQRTCRFVTALVLSRKGMEDVCSLGTVEGELLYEPRGENGFGYDPLFYYPEFDKTFAELSAEEKNSVSHRKRALAALLEKLNQQ